MVFGSLNVDKMRIQTSCIEAVRENCVIRTSFISLQSNREFKSHLDLQQTRNLKGVFC